VTSSSLINFQAVHQTTWPWHPPQQYHRRPPRPLAGTTNFYYGMWVLPRRLSCYVSNIMSHSIIEISLDLAVASVPVAAAAAE